MPTMSEIRAELSDYEWRPASYEAGEIDRHVCDDAHCAECGRQGLIYHPFTKQGVSYRAFAECPKCKLIVEF